MENRKRRASGLYAEYFVGFLFLGFGLWDVVRKHTIGGAWWIALSAWFIAQAVLESRGRRVPKRAFRLLLGLLGAWLAMELILHWRF
jgi:hypothetical protein